MRIAVLGVGLIGGSIGLAARERLDAEVLGWDPSDEALRIARSRGAVSRAATSLAEAVHGAEAVFCAAPIGRLRELVAQALVDAGVDCVVTDVGSAKRAVLAGVQDPRFVASHPLAGAETAGVAHARADLFVGAAWFLIPQPHTSERLCERLQRLIGGLGARPLAIDAETHDRMIAAVSHLPHVLANVLVAQATATLDHLVEARDDRAAGPSFRDATRVAGAPSAIWTDIYLANRDAIVDQVDETIARLQAARELLADGDAAAITAWNDAAAADRRSILDDGGAGQVP